MAIFVISSLLIGMVLGQRCKVLVLLPAILLMLTATIIAGIITADTASAIALTAAASISGLQIGYFAGTGIRYFMAAARASRLRSGTLGGSLPARRPTN